MKATGIIKREMEVEDLLISHVLASQALFFVAFCIRVSSLPAQVNLNEMGKLTSRMGTKVPQLQSLC